jgi:hypothetical protein
MPAATFFWKCFATAVFLWLVFFGFSEVAKSAQALPLQYLLFGIGGIFCVGAVLAFICAVIASIWKRP